MNRLRIGIDVGGTNTDAVVIDAHGKVQGWFKSATTIDVRDGISAAIRGVLATVDKSDVRQVMLGTTHSLNALIQRKGLGRVGILRIGAPATLAIPPLAGWPTELADALRGPVSIIRGGHEHDGTEFMPLDEDGVRSFAESCTYGVDAIALTSVGSPVRADHEERAAAIIEEVVGNAVPITLGREVAGTGIIERENTATLNASLHFVGRGIVTGLLEILEEHSLRADVYLTQNDGTLLGAEEALRRPILSIGSGATNSMRGAAYLSQLSNAIIMDVGGTSTDVGLLVDGFPRTSAHNVEIGGVRTNFRMPDLISVALGGGTVVRHEPQLALGPDSVGYQLTSKALVFGGDTMTLSDVSVAAGRADFGDPHAVESMDRGLRQDTVDLVDEQLRILADRIKASRTEIPLVAVGGGAHLVPGTIPGVSEVIRPEYASVANAIGAAIAEASGTVDRNFVFSQSSRTECLDQAKEMATDAAIRAGADPTSVRITTVTEIPMTYMPGDCARVIVKAVGPLMESPEPALIAD
ncbi:hydantoinase/oxoprolinase family protein [Arthrobacter bambusae]|uniref:hydantoinase/oxoprolinase family protein n=1 Tax=Arthrobacter bambusae TaxID=1338426 RepID=UPI002788EFD8|nr:hydantoinase/oxoprolinase family protein [Arthrobacter bambusae]MDQ0212988.1 N-methylhydantoinase A/oxoprolinase/acetone carboxylase beta subunit [Arthrobacter bambusae]MDQ0237294.1 N-methylhydantoinase A/oxoprolinase/acetone carboxylase beta subunit [Arthrobacter bambusae]